MNVVEKFVSLNNLGIKCGRSVLKRRTATHIAKFLAEEIWNWIFNYTYGKSDSFAINLKLTTWASKVIFFNSIDFRTYFSIFFNTRF